MAKPMGKKKISVDFTGVEAGGSRTCPDGRYVAKVDKVTVQTSDNSGKDYLKWELSVVGPSSKGARLYNNTTLQPQGLFALKRFLTCLGADVEDGEMDLDLSEYPDMEIGVEVVNEEYQGKQRPQIADVFPPDELEESKAEPKEEADDDEKPAKASSFKKGNKVQFEDEDGRTKKGVILKIDGEEAVVDVKGEEWTVDLKELSAQD